MKQVLENYNTGSVRVADVPAPGMQPKTLLVRTAASLISIGTEKAMLEVASKSLLGKALARPDWVRQVVDKVQSDGLMETYRQARARLDMPVPLGYSAAGVVIEAGAGVTGIHVGDRVACAGHPYAGHAEVIAVPRNLAVLIPEQVDFEDASFAMLGAIAMNAVRLAAPALGERVAVIGMGLLGLLALQMLRAAGCRVLAVDIAPGKLELAHQLGASRLALSTANVEEIAREFSGGYGVDAALVFASADSSEPVEQAASITREQGRVLVPGLVKLDLPRKTFFEKELRLIVPKAGGPGGADADYEARGRDLPLPFVRWTEGRNLASFLELIADNRLTVKPLITHRFPIAQALDAYRLIQGHGPTAQPVPIGVILDYPMDPGVESVRTVQVTTLPGRVHNDSIGVGLIGAGLFTRGVFLPYLKDAQGLALRGVATASGVSGLHAAETAGFDYTTTDYTELLADPKISAVLITTRHNLHASMVIAALRAGKHVFVEKPLCLNATELEEVMDAWRHAGEAAPVVMVGFNRRFASASQALEKSMGDGACLIQCRVNAGAIPAGSWVQDTDEGGGRAVGEICHFIDLIHALSGGRTKSVTAAAMAETGDVHLNDSLSITLELDNGSAANILYAANGDKSFARERVEVFRSGSVGVIDNFRSYSITRGGRTRHWKSLSLDRGHRAELDAFFSGIRKGVPPVAMDDYYATTSATFAILESLRSRSVIRVNQSTGGRG
ncbi:MAG TPA: bi-domain-containing oxidoreductase [Bryobacteraceae bacterium]|jgi:predicted dehydrogenase/threonine dehydrogenase-like Zn-dependent dehydrogenase